MRRFLLIFSMVSLSACGLAKPKHVDYADEGETQEASGGAKVASGSQASGTTTSGSKPSTGDAGAKVPDTAAADPCEAALTAFTTSMKPAIKTAGCALSSCHAAQPIAGGKLADGDDTLNRATLKNYAGGVAMKLFGKISSGTHGGGNLSAKLPLAKIEAWITPEAKCTK